MLKIRDTLGVVAMVIGLGACSGPVQQTCAPGVGKPLAVFTLYFGKAIAGRDELTEPEWQSFLEDTVGINLPNGYTVFDANGAWMNRVTRKTVKEATKVVVAALPVSDDSDIAVARIRHAYQTQFHQQVV